MAYTTAAAFKTFRDISGAGDDTLIGTLITAVQQAIDNYTGRTFEGSAEDRTFDARYDVEGLTLWVYDVGDLASITSVTNGDDSTVASTEYVTIPRNAVAKGIPIRGLRLKASEGLIWRYTDDGDHEDAITINGVWAYSEEAPTDIVQAAHLWIADLYDKRLSSDGDLVIVPGTSVSVNRSIPGTVKAILDMYRLVR